MSFQTIASPAEGLFKDRGSRFLAHLFPVRNRAEVDVRLKEIQARYPDARHICYAYRLGAEAFSSDAGEPSGSAGPPILRQLQSAGLTHALGVVVRYFGGTKLGIPGLIEAYETATREAIRAAEVMEYFETLRFCIGFSYASTSAVNQALQRWKVVRLSEHFTENCVFELEVRKEWYPDLARQLESFVFLMEPIPEA